MNNRQNKKRFGALINESTYNRVNEFVRNNELITGKLVHGNILEIGLQLFFKEVEKRPFEELAVEYLTTGGATNEK